ncbi:MAG: VOC family protein [Deltaproteobacteria bacterium]|nr:VOC family protein [Deltaproteobacteria bacterium]
MMDISLAALGLALIAAPEGTSPAMPVVIPATETSPSKTVMPTRDWVAPPPELLPVRLAGMALYVNNLEAQRKWYETMFGMKVHRIYERDGVIFEYVMVTPGGNTAALPLMTSMRPPGYNAFSRIVIEVPNARALAEHIHSQGSSMSVVAKNIVYMVMDPEGNQIEIFNSKIPERPAKQG